MCEKCQPEIEKKEGILSKTEYIEKCICKCPPDKIIKKSESVYDNDAKVVRDYEVLICLECKHRLNI